MRGEEGTFVAAMGNTTSRHVALGWRLLVLSWAAC